MNQTMLAETVEIGGQTYTVIKASDPIESESKTGLKTWTGYIVRDREGKHFLTSSWFNVNKKTGNQSVTQFAEPYYCDPKNIGRSNETTNRSQAESEFDSMIQKEKDRRQADKPLPMLAATFRDKINPKKSRSHKIRYPAGVQPKFDGMRMLYNGTEAWSRGNKPILDQVLEHLQFETRGATVDGELILPDNPTVNITRSATAKFHPGISDKLVYRVYDIVDMAGGYKSRYEMLKMIVESCGNPNIILAETHFINSEAEIYPLHEDFTKRGFEGTIIRNLDADYAAGKRVDDLQKFKDFVDAEFKIVDVIPAGGGSSAKVGKFVCVDDKGDTFESTATGSEKDREEYLVNKHKYIGKFAKVKFRELSGAKQVPFHSNVLEVRDTKTGGH